MEFGDSLLVIGLHRAQGRDRLTQMM